MDGGDGRRAPAKSGLTAEGFARLLASLDPDNARAAERYEGLRRTLVRFFQWRGAPSPDEHADETFDRVARRLAEGVAVANIGGYCYEVARLVALEARKRPDLRGAALDPILAAPRAPVADEALLKEVRMACLEECLAGLAAEHRALVREYHLGDPRGRIDRRRDLAERLGLRREALANRAQRVRDMLERCVRDCVRRKSTG